MTNYHQEFHIRLSGDRILKILGKTINIDGFDRDIFEHKGKTNYRITDAKTGMILFCGETQEKLYEDVAHRIEKAIKFFKSHANTIVKDREEEFSELLKYHNNK